MARTTPIHAIELMDPPVKPRAERRHKTHCAELRKWETWTTHGGAEVIENIREDNPNDVADALIARKKSRALHSAFDDSGIKEGKAKWKAKATNFVDDWDPTDWSAEALHEVLAEEFDKLEADLRELEMFHERRARERAAFQELLRLEDDEEDAPRPSKGIFGSKQKVKDATVELMSDREHKLRSHVAWPSPAHKPRKLRPSDQQNSYGKPRFQERVGRGPFRSVDPVGLTGVARIGRNRKVG